MNHEKCNGFDRTRWRALNHTANPAYWDKSVMVLYILLLNVESKYFCTHCCSFMQLDLGHLRIKNEFSWHGYPEKDPSAVHLDILDAEVLFFL